METNEFKRIVDACLKGSDFKKRGSNYYRIFPDVICVVDLQRSYFNKSYYINIGYCIVALHPEVHFPKCSECDIRSRFTFDLNGKLVDNIVLDSIKSADDLVAQLTHNVKKLILGVDNIQGLKGLLERKPILLYRTSIDAKITSECDLEKTRCHRVCYGDDSIVITHLCFHGKELKVASRGTRIAFEIPRSTLD